MNENIQKMLELLSQDEEAMKKLSAIPVYEETQGIIVLAVILYVLVQEDAILGEKEFFNVEDVRRVARNRMALVQPMLKALRENNQKEIDRYEDITDILMKEISSDIDIKSMPSAKLPAAKAFARVHNEVLEYFIKLKKKPEKVEQFIEQAYQETKSSDFAVIADRVYDLVKQDESETRETSLEEMPKAVLKGKDYEALVEAGMVDNEQW